VSSFYGFWQQTKDAPEVDIDFAKLIGLMPRVYVNNLGVVELPAPNAGLFNGTVADLFLRRQSTREYSTQPVPLATLSTLLHYAAGVKGYLSAYGYGRFPMRMFPSAGGLMPTEVYILVVAVEGLAVHGIYHYNPIGHCLELLREDAAAAGDVMADLLAGMPPFLDIRPPMAVLLSSRFGPVEEKYSARGGRFALLDAGIVIENFYLAATGLGLGLVAVGGSHDELAAAAIGLDPCRDHEAPVAAMLLGMPGEAAVAS
jgi:SagB-type dehydrogenase family enzyme